MTLLKLIDNCRRLQSAMEISYLDDLEPVLHLTYEEAFEVYDNALPDAVLINFPLTPPIPGTFWYTCYGIRTFVERIDS